MVESDGERSESCIKEVPMSGERNRFSRSKSPKARWHQDGVEEPETTTTASATNDVASSASSTSTADNTPPEATASKNEEKSQTEANSTTATATTTTSQRKRKWLTNDASKKTSTSVMVTISSDALKSYLPTSASEIAPPVVPSSDHSAANGSGEVEPGLPATKRKVVDANTADASSDSVQFNKQTSRTVIIEVFAAYTSNICTSNQSNSVMLSNNFIINQLKLTSIELHTYKRKFFSILEFITELE